MMSFETKTNPELDFDKVMILYRKYCKKEREKGKEPVSFQRFVTGRY